MISPFTKFSHRSYAADASALDGSPTIPPLCEGAGTASILVINSGSSSLKFAVLDPQTEGCLAFGIAERLVMHGASLQMTDLERCQSPLPNCSRINTRWQFLTPPFTRAQVLTNSRFSIPKLIRN